MKIQEFIAKWRKVELKERSAAQEHFLDLCAAFDHPTPAAADPSGECFCFERGAAKHAGGGGFADVWKRGHFGWEYKGKHKDLNAAYDQLLQYRDALENPPLLVLCDLDRIVVHTNFTGTASDTHEIPLEDLGEARNIEIVRAVFHDPEALRPGRTSIAVTQDAARQVAEIAAAMRGRGLEPAAVAHFLDRIVFCMFAEDVGLLPDMVFTRIAEKVAGDPDRFAHLLGELFDTMATGGDFGLESIRHFNGNLFDDRTVLDLTPEEIRRIAEASALDWSAVDPSIIGTLFERGLDPAKRSQLGAHFTGRQDIELVVDAVIVTVLRREWDEIRSTIENLLSTGRKTPPAKPAKKPPSPAVMKKARGEASSLLHKFLHRLQHVRILDPACGSGNFLYVALLRLKDLEKEAILFGNEHGLGPFLPMAGPHQLFGIEINTYAHDLAQMTVWLGWLQWIRGNGFGFPAEPILRPLTDNIRLMDAILARDKDGNPTEPDWPEVDFIIGNPPFLGDKLMRSELGDSYVNDLRGHYAGRIPGQSDFCCYWFEKALSHLNASKCRRVGLLATQGIRGGANREVLKRIKRSGDIFWAQSDRPWILDGANVHVSMVGFDRGEEEMRTLDGRIVQEIHSNLTSVANVVSAIVLDRNENSGLCFVGSTKKAPLDIAEDLALEMLRSPNPHGLPNSDVIVPYVNGMDVTRRSRHRWIIDYPTSLSESEATRYEAPFKYIQINVYPLRANHKETVQRKFWWRLARPVPELKEAIADLPRFLATLQVSKHRLFAWLNYPANPDHQLTVFARSDDLFFGVLHSRFHEVWALRTGTRLETRPRYTPSTCFDTFPLPPGVFDPADPLTGAHADIAAAAKELNALREGWLNPPDWTREEVLEFPGTVGGPWDRFIDPATVEDRGGFQVGTVRYPRLVPRNDDCAKKLKKRTLTNLYNERPAWLAACHAKLNTAVAAAYGWPDGLSDEEILERLLALNLAQAADAGDSENAEP